jgi:hypothetical protein
MQGEGEEGGVMFWIGREGEGEEGGFALWSVGESGR